MLEGVGFVKEKWVRIHYVKMFLRELCCKLRCSGAILLHSESPEV